MALFATKCVARSTTALHPCARTATSAADVFWHTQQPQQQQQRACFSSKRRVRYGSERASRESTKLLSFVQQKQKAQLNKLRASLATEAVAKLPLSLDTDATITPAAVEHINDNDTSSRDMQDLAYMRRLKAAKQKRVQHLPLFKPNSPLLQHFGAQTTLAQFAHLPPLAFTGPVIVLHSQQEEAVYASYLRAQKVVGIDTEAKPDFQTNKPANPVCLLQLATLERAFVYRLQRNQPLPPILQSILADPHVLKVGHSLHDDVRQLRSAQLVPAVHATVDTLPIANKLGCVRPGLRTLAQLFLGGTISKDMQVSNWEAPRLSAAQITYAATDAWAPLRVLLAMLNVDATRLLLRTKSYSSSGRTLVDDDHDKLLGLLHAFALSQQQKQQKL